MFKCDKCGKTTEPREKLTKRPIMFRDRVYQNLIVVGKKTFPITSFGKEIVKEINLCETCASKEK